MRGSRSKGLVTPFQRFQVHGNLFERSSKLMLDFFSI